MHWLQMKLKKSEQRMISATINYDFEAFDAIVVYSDRKVTEDATTDWAKN